MISYNVDQIIKFPEDYLLQINKSNRTQTLIILKKGIWTWLKIHLGACLGLFNKDTIHLSEIAKYVLANKTQIDPKLALIIDQKITVWNSKRPSNLKIKTLDPNFCSEFKIHNNGHFSKWLNMKERNIDADFVKIVPEGFSFVRTCVLSAESCKDKFKDFTLSFPKGSVYVVSLQASRYSSFFILKKCFPDLHKIVSCLNGDCNEGTNGLAQLAVRGISVDILFYKDWFNKIHTKMIFLS